MEKFEPIVLVEKAHKFGTHYDLLKFNALLNELNTEQFDQFCNSIVQKSRIYFEKVEITNDQHTLYEEY